MQRLVAAVEAGGARSPGATRRRHGTGLSEESRSPGWRRSCHVPLHPRRHSRSRKQCSALPRAMW
ncbi:hypothetical protein IG631_02329 [Alternaria alternata]|nr:hypothetical protein IG631_02329 [Alternaria alternata]